MHKTLNISSLSEDNPKEQSNNIGDDATEEGWIDDKKVQDNCETTSDKEINVGTISNVLGMDVSADYFTKEVPKQGSFRVEKSVVESFKLNTGTRCFQNGEWYETIMKGVSSFNPYCVFMIRRHQVNKRRNKLSRRKSRFFFADLYCKFSDCNMKCKVEMYNEDTVNVLFDGDINHCIEETRSRPISGEKRKLYQKELEAGQKPYKLYLNKFHEIPDEVKVAGNMSNVGSSQTVIRKISTESSRKNVCDQNEIDSLKKMAANMNADTKQKVVKGFIQHISVLPTFVMYWNEAGVRLWHDLAKDNVVFWDATGSIIKPRRDEKRFLYYELAVANPIAGNATIPVCSMLSSSHDQPQIQYWISKFRLSEKKIFGHANTVIPRQINSDRSLVLIITALLEFNQETLSLFRSRAWRILIGDATESDIKKVMPHGCLSHMMKDFKTLCKKYYAANFEYGMYLFSLLINVDTIQAAKTTLKSIFYILLSKYLTPKTKLSAEYIDKRLLTLPSGCDELEEDDQEIDENIASTDINPNKFSEEQFLLKNEENEFSSFGLRLKEDVLSDLMSVENLTIYDVNTRYSPTLADAFLSKYMSTFPIWSNILMGDLTRHKKAAANVTSQVAEFSKTNAKMEQRFCVLKDISLRSRQLTRLDVFSSDLLIHTEAIQKLACLEFIKKKSRKLKKAGKVIEESWNKKLKSEEQSAVGKYQKTPNRPVKTIPDKIENKCKRNKTTPKNVRKTKCKDVSYEDQSEDVTGNGVLQKGVNTEVPVIKKHQSNNTSKQQTTVTRANEYNASWTANALFIQDSELKTSFTIDNSPLLKELFCNITEHSSKPYVLQTFLDSNTPLQNIGNTCWFNATTQVFKRSCFMKDANENYLQSLSYHTDIKNMLKVYHQTATGQEVSDKLLHETMHEISDRFQMKVGDQNDAHEFVTTGLADIMKDNIENCIQVNYQH